MRRLTTRAGFTLVELLAVIAMIALMTALLFPVINKGKRNAQAAYDLNNFRQILVGAQMYAGDNNDFLPQPGWGTRTACWAAGPGIPLGGFPPTLATYTNLLPRQQASFTKGQLYDFLKKDNSLRCPGDNLLDNPFLRRRIYISSYVWNSAIVGFPSDSLLDVTPTFRLRQFRSDAILVWEADEKRPFCFNDFANFPDEGVTTRHDNGPTVGRFDGGAERMALTQFVALSGEMAPTQELAGTGWQHSRIRAPNALWCSPVNSGVPEQNEDHP